MTSPARARIGTTLVFCLVAFAPAARSQEVSGSGFAKNGFYVGASNVPNFTFTGVTFDGSSYYKQIGGDEIMILPKLEPKSTIRAVGGFRLTRGSFEISYERTHHNGTFLGLTGEATFYSLNFDERIYAMTRGRIQPYGLIGGSIPRLTVKDGSFLNDQIADAHFHGYGINTEAGVTVFPISRVGIGAGYRYRAMWFDTVNGVSHTTYELRPRFRETAGSVTLNAFFTF